MHTRPDVTAVCLVIAGALVLGACGAGAAGDAGTPPVAQSPTTVAPASTATTAAAVDVLPGVDPEGQTVEGLLDAPDGSERSYHVYEPASLETDAEVPLLIALHGGTGWGLQFQATSGFDDIAEANGFLVAYPDGTEIPSMPGRRVWNGGRCCGPAQQDGDDIDDIGFISSLIDELEAGYVIDSQRIYVTGHSNGAIMSYRVACELADEVAAVAFQAGALEIEPCSPDRPVSVLNIHGAADANLPIDGGPGNGISGVSFTSPVDSVERFAELDGCLGLPTESVDTVNSDVTRTTWDPCDDGTEVAFVRVEGASHAWMGQPGRPAQEAISGPAYEDFDSALAIWTFLSAHPRADEG